jgi:CheY-like chemotaxis protein
MNQPKILIVDDDADVRRMLTEYLGGHGTRCRRWATARR